MSIKVLFTYDYGEENMKKIKELGYEIKIVNEREVKYSKELEDTEVLVCYNPFNTLDVSELKNLKWIQLSSIGIDQVPPNSLEDKVILTNNKGGYSIPIGEWIVMNILQGLKNSKKLFEQQFKNIWKMDTSVLEVYGKKIGFVGTGSIAKEAAKRLQGFGVEILGLNTNGRPIEFFDKCYGSDSKSEFFSKCHVVVITIPYTKQTHRFIDDKCFNKMKNGVCFINVARGAVVDEKALIRNLKDGKVSCAALDVFDEEPLCKENEFWGLDNVIITPHNSWVSEMRNIRRFEGIYENMKRYAENKPLKNLVDINKGY